MRFCTASTVAGPVFESDRSASAVTVVVTRFAAALPLLLVESGSALDVLARATLTRVPATGAVTVTVRVIESPLASVATAGQVTTPLDAVPPLLAVTKVTPAGSVSRTTTARATVGPWLPTTMV